MAKLIDHNADSKGPPIGVDGLLRFIDEINEIRAKSGNRFRFEPSMDQDRGVLEMKEHLGIPRPAEPYTPSPRYYGVVRIAGPVR
jgi:hypothetical protein